MKTFYIFKINREYNKTKSINLYVVFKTIFKQNKKNINMAFNTYNNIVSSINKDFFNKYIYELLYKEESYTKFKNIHMYNNYLTGEVSKMVINNTYILIKSNIFDNIFLKYLYEINNLFICNFTNDIYYYTKNKKIINKK